MKPAGSCQRQNAPRRLPSNLITQVAGQFRQLLLQTCVATVVGHRHQLHAVRTEHTEDLLTPARGAPSRTFDTMDSSPTNDDKLAAHDQRGGRFHSLLTP